jgi:hypothetical protein
MVQWEGAEQPATVFRQSKKQRVAGPVTILALGALGISGLASSQDLYGQVLASLAVLLAAGGTLGIIASLRGKTYIALLRDGILQRSIAGWSFIPWESIEAVGYYTVYWQTNLGLKTKEPPRTGGLFRFTAGLDRRFRGLAGGWNTGLPIWPVEHGEEMVALVKRCIADPGARARLGQGN